MTPTKKTPKLPPLPPVKKNSYPPPPPINLTQRQIMLSFAYLAYTGEGLVNPHPETEILNHINRGMTQIPVLCDSPGRSAWSVVWGPCIYAVPGSYYQDNMVYVVKKNNTQQYAIAIRGTNFRSEVDWLLEDFGVMQLMNWPLGASTPNPAGAFVSESTSIDVKIVLGMIDPATGTTLSQFLTRQTATHAINLCVTGHSLGGVISGTLALYFLDNPAVWGGSQGSTVTFISFAAPTAGNAQFASYSNSRFANATRPPSAIWDANLRTNGDVVECSYDLATMVYTSSNIYTPSTDSAGPIFSTYGSNINFGSLSGFQEAKWDAFQEIVLAEIGPLTLNQNYTQLAPGGGAPIPGIFNGPPQPSDGYFMDYLYAFIAQAEWQHSFSYPYIFGLDAQLLSPQIVVRNVFAITSINPSSATAGAQTPVTITGTSFTSLASPSINAASPIRFSNLVVVSDTQITATINFTFPTGDNPTTIWVSGIVGTGYQNSNALSVKINAARR